MEADCAFLYQNDLAGPLRTPHLGQDGLCQERGPQSQESHFQEDFSCGMNVIPIFADHHSLIWVRKAMPYRLLAPAVGLAG